MKPRPEDAANQPEAANPDRRLATDPFGAFQAAPINRQIEWITSTRATWVLLMLFSSAVGLSVAILDPLYVVGGLVGLAALVVLAYYPWFGALAYLTFEYASLPILFPWMRPLQMGKLIVGATFLAWLVNSLSKKRFSFARDSLSLVWLAWLLLALFSSTWASNPDTAIKNSVVFATFFSMYLLIVTLIDSAAKWKWLVWCFMLLNLKMSQFQLRAFYSGLSSAADKYLFVRMGTGAGHYGFFHNSNDFGTTMCMAIPIAFYLIVSSKSRLAKYVGTATFAAFTLSILHSGSRGSAVTLSAMAIVYALKSSRKVLGFAVIVLFGIGFWTFAGSEWQEGFQSGINYDQDKTASERIVAWKAGARMFFDSPMTGVGMGNFPVVLRSMRVLDKDKAVGAHSNWIESTSELGIPGLLLYLTILILAFRYNHHTRRLASGDDEQAIFVRGLSHAFDLSTVGFVVAGTFTSILYYPFLFTNLALLMSLRNVALNSVVETPQ